MLKVLDGEDVEGLAGHNRAHDQRNGDGQAEVDWNAGVLQVIDNRGPTKLGTAHRSQASCTLNARAEFGNRHSCLGLGENERKQIAFAPDIIERLAVAREDDWKVGERRRSIADTDQAHTMIIHLQRVAELQWAIRKKEAVTCFVDDGGVGLAQVGSGA